MKVTLQGVDKVNNYLSKYETDLIMNATKAISDASYFLEGEIKDAMQGKRPPLPRRVDTGRLVNSVKHHGMNKPLYATVETNVDYAEYVEYGTSRMKPGQHFKVSADRNTAKITKYVQDSIKK